LRPWSSSLRNWTSVEGLNAGGPKCGTALSVNRRVLRQTSGALRRTEGSWRPRCARTKRKSLTLEALEPHGRQPAPDAREILRPDRHLSSMLDAAPRERRAGRRKIRNQANGLSRVGGIEPSRTLTALRSLAANWRQSGLRKFSLRQGRDGGVAVRISRKTRPPSIFRRFATRRKGSAAKGCGTSRKPACQKYPIWVQIYPEWVQIRFRQICLARCSRAFNRACSALSLANPIRNFNSLKSSQRPAPGAAPFSASSKSSPRWGSWPPPPMAIESSTMRTGSRRCFMSCINWS
jgi:hypothetical protein